MPSFDPHAIDVDDDILWQDDDLSGWETLEVLDLSDPDYEEMLPPTPDGRRV